MDEEEFGALQQCVFPTEAEIKRFRQVVVNVVMATDIFDRELCDMRDNRWAKAFAEREPGAMPDEDDENRKATIVIEHVRIAPMCIKGSALRVERAIYVQSPNL
jgi:hypothetical protein